MNASSTPHRDDEPAAISRRTRLGVLFGISAYGLWGILPVYFKFLNGVATSDVVAHRIVWSLAALLLLVTLLGGWSKVRHALTNRASFRLLVMTSALIAINWLLYFYAITSGHILAGSLGYYLNPLANILLGRLLLHERLSRLQWSAVALAGAGVAVLATGALDTLWISLSLCFSFAFYGLLRKRVAVDSVTGLTVETMLLFPFALGWLAFGVASGRALFGNGPLQPWLLVASGIVSTVPLLLFTEAARRLRYATVGMLQFIAPSMQFGLAVLVYGEPFTRTHAIAFTAIWIALALFVFGSIRRLIAPLPE